MTMFKYGLLACWLGAFGLTVVAQEAAPNTAPTSTTVVVNTVYGDEKQPPAPTETEQARGFIAFTRPGVRVILPGMAPEAAERVERLEIAACADETEPAVLAIHALKNLRNVRVSVGAMTTNDSQIPAAAFEIRSLKYGLRQGETRWGLYNEGVLEAPYYLEQRDGVDVRAGRSQPFWLTLHVPANTPPGKYQGMVTVTAEGAPAAEFPLSVEVYPFTLAQPKGIAYSLYTEMLDDPAALKTQFADLRAHGMTTVAFYGQSGLALAPTSDTVKIDWNGQSLLEKNMAAYQAAGFPESALWLVCDDLTPACKKFGPVESEAFARVYRDVIAQIVAHGKAAGWPEIIIQPVDEPFEHDDLLASAKRYLDLLRGVPGVRTESDGMNGKWENFGDDFYRLSDVLVLHDGPTLHRRSLNMDEWWAFRKKADADGKRLWFYNIDLTGWHPEPMRFMLGYGLWQCQGQGVIEWGYTYCDATQDWKKTYAQPLLPGEIYWFPPLAGVTSGGPTIGYEAMREGIDDYRYLLTLQQTVEKAKGSGNERLAKMAEEIWNGVQAKLATAGFEGCKMTAMQGRWTGPCDATADGHRTLRGEFKLANNWAFGDYDALRAQIAFGLKRLLAEMEQ